MNSEHYFDIPFENLKMLTVLGCGQYGTVKLVQDTETETPYALKCLPKIKLLHWNIEHHAIAEKEIMLRINHPFIVKLHNTYQDSRQVGLFEAIPFF